MFGHAVDAISMSVQGSHKGFGKHTVQLGGIESPGVFPGHLEGVKCGVVVPRNWGITMFRQMMHAKGQCLNMNENTTSKHRNEIVN